MNHITSISIFVSDFAPSLFCLPCHAFDIDITCTWNGKTVRNASMELSHLGTSLSNGNLLFKSSFRSWLANQIRWSNVLDIQLWNKMYTREYNWVSKSMSRINNYISLFLWRPQFYLVEFQTIFSNIFAGWKNLVKYTAPYYQYGPAGPYYWYAMVNSFFIFTIFLSKLRSPYNNVSTAAQWGDSLQKRWNGYKNWWKYFLDLILKNH